MPVYKVKLRVEAVVWAEDRKEAMERGYTALGEEIGNLDWYDVKASEVGTVDDLPDRWDKDTLVYHAGGGDLTVQEALDRAEQEQEVEEDEDADEIWLP